MSLTLDDRLALSLGRLIVRAESLQVQLEEKEAENDVLRVELEEALFPAKK